MRQGKGSVFRRFPPIRKAVRAGRRRNTGRKEGERLHPRCGHARRHAPVRRLPRAAGPALPRGRVEKFPAKYKN